MIHMIHPGNRRLYEREVEALCRLRNSQDAGLPWAAADAPSRLGDSDDAFDLAAFASNGSLSASLRLRSTHQGSIIADAFPHLVPAAEGPLKGSAIYEATYYHVTPGYRDEGGLASRNRMHLAMLETMLDRQAQRLIALVGMESIPCLREGSGLRLRPIGVPATFDTHVLLAFEIGVAAEDLAWARACLNTHERQLFEARPPKVGDEGLRASSVSRPASQSAMDVLP